MIDIKVSTKYSKIAIFKLIDAKENQLREIQELIGENSHVIRIFVEDDMMVLEYVPFNFIQCWENDFTEIKTPKEEMNPQNELNDALDTVLLKDPQSKYGGKTLREIFDKHDEEWVSWTLENMHNKYIRDKVKFILDSGYWRV